MEDIWLDSRPQSPRYLVISDLFPIELLLFESYVIIRALLKMDMIDLQQVFYCKIVATDSQIYLKMDNIW